jgi:hypothetical protein
MASISWDELLDAVAERVFVTGDLTDDEIAIVEATVEVLVAKGAAVAIEDDGLDGPGTS